MPGCSDRDSAALFGGAGEKKRLRPPSAPEPFHERLGVQAFTLDVIDAITIDAILNWSARLKMPWRAAIQAKSV